MAEKRTRATDNTESKEEPSIAGTIVVSNVSHETSENDIFIYFQKRRNQGGEVLGVCVKPKSQEALVYFEDDKVAKAVVNSKNHVIKGHSVDVELYEKYMERVRRTVLVSKLSSNTIERSVKHHFEERSNDGGEIENVKILEKGEALVVFKNQEVAKNLIDKRQLKFKGKEVLVAKPESFELEPKKVQKQGDIKTAGKEERTIVVSEFREGTTQNIIHIHFQRKKNKGGEVEGVILSPEKKEAFVIFEDPKVAQQVVNSEQKIKGKTVNVKLLKGETKPPERKVEPGETQPPERKVEPGETKPPERKVEPGETQPPERKVEPGTILVTGIPEGITDKRVIIHFQKKANGGGDVSRVKFSSDGTKALVTFADIEVAKRAAEKPHKLDGKSVTVTLDDKEEYEVKTIQAEAAMTSELENKSEIKTQPRETKPEQAMPHFVVIPPTIDKVFSTVTATIDPALLNTAREDFWKNLLNVIRKDCGVQCKLVWQPSGFEVMLTGRLSQVTQAGEILALKCKKQYQKLQSSNQQAENSMQDGMNISQNVKSLKSTALENDGQTRAREKEPRNNNTSMTADCQDGPTANNVAEVEGKSLRMDGKLYEVDAKSDDSINANPTNNLFSPTSMSTSPPDDKKSLIIPQTPVNDQATATPKIEIKPEGEETDTASSRRSNPTAEAELNSKNLATTPASTLNDPSDSAPANSEDNAKTVGDKKSSTIPQTPVNNQATSPNSEDNAKTVGNEPHDARTSRDNQTGDALSGKSESLGQQESNIDGKPSEEVKNESEGTDTPLSTPSRLKAGTQNKNPASLQASNITNQSESLPDSEDNAIHNEPTGNEQHHTITDPTGRGKYLKNSGDNKTGDPLSDNAESLTDKPRCTFTKHQSGNEQKDAFTPLPGQESEGSNTSPNPASNSAEGNTQIQPDEQQQATSDTKSNERPSAPESISTETSYKTSRSKHEMKPTCKTEIPIPSPRRKIIQSGLSKSCDQLDSNIDRNAASSRSLLSEEVKAESEGTDTPLSTPSRLKAGIQSKNPASLQASIINDQSQLPPNSEDNAIHHEPTGSEQHHTITDPTGRGKSLKNSDPASNSAEGNSQIQHNERKATSDTNSNERPSVPASMNTETSDKTSACKNEMEPASKTDMNKDCNGPQRETPTPAPRQIKQGGGRTCGAKFSSPSIDTQSRKDGPMPTGTTRNHTSASKEKKENNDCDTIDEN